MDANVELEMSSPPVEGAPLMPTDQQNDEHETSYSSEKDKLSGGKITQRYAYTTYCHVTSDFFRIRFGSFFLEVAIMEHFLQRIALLRHWCNNQNEKSKYKSSLLNYLTYQILNRALTSRKCSI